MKSHARLSALTVTGLLTALGFCQSPANLIEQGVTKASAVPSAYVYVQTHNGVMAYTASDAGKLATIKGSPFPVSGQMEAINSKYLISVGTTNLHTYPVASAGTVGKAASQINTAAYGGSECGTTNFDPALLDHSGKFFYVQLYQGLANCTAWQSYDVGSKGQFSFIGDVYGTSFGDGNADATTALTFDSSDRYAYGFEWNETLYQSSFAPFVRESSGDLSGNASFTESDPTPDPNLNYYLTPVMAAADPTEHLAVVMFPWLYGGNGAGTTNVQLASYTINNGNGSVVSTNTQDNVPFTVLAQANAISMSWKGNFVAVGGDVGLQVFNFDGAKSPSALTGNLLPKVQMDQVSWDKANHLYALSYETGQLYVYSITSKNAVLASGSPITIKGAYGVIGLIVVPK